jgi:hypothetical protein
VVTLAFEDGTVRLDGVELNDPGTLPGVEYDPRAECWRAPAERYPALRAALDDALDGTRTPGARIEDCVLSAPALALSSTYELRPYQRSALSAWLDTGDGRLAARWSFPPGAARPSSR